MAPSQAAEPLVELRSVRKSFGDNVVLKGVDLAIAPGEAIVIAGPSGSGKSTMLRCINGLEEIDSGSVTFDGRAGRPALQDDRPDARRHRHGLSAVQPLRAQDRAGEHHARADQGQGHRAGGGPRARPRAARDGRHPGEGSGLARGPVGRPAAARRDRALDAVHGLLAHAALEGRTFTADAVAAALGRDRDEVIDLLDDRLVLDDEHPGGLVREAGSLSLDGGTGKRHLWLYRFDAELDWWTLYHRGLAPGRRRAAALALARAVERAYGAELPRAAGPLARLYELAGDAGAARRVRPMADGGSDPLVVVWRANAVVEAPDPAGRPERRRASRILLTAAAALSGPGPYHDGLSFAQRAYRLAPLRHDRAEALFLNGVHHFKLGAYGEARVQLNLALALRRELGDRKGEADARAALALIDTRRGDNAAARLELAFVLEIYREIGDRDGEAATRHSLAGLYHGEGQFDAARRELTGVAAFLHDAGDRQGEADTLQRIARLEMEQGNFAAAHERLIGTLDIYAQLGDRHGEADVRHNLARIELELGDADRARREFMRVLSAYRELGDRVGEAATRHSLASIAIEQGVWDKAKRELARVLELGRELDDEEVVAAALEGLEIIAEATGAPATD